MRRVSTQRKPLCFFAARFDVPRSIAFYQQLGFALANSFTPPDAEEMSWAWLESGSANLMLAKASEPVVPEQQAILFYLYVDDVAAAHETLFAAGLHPNAITTPFYAPRGEFRLVDPDGYCLMMTHTG
jgi:predicted enzyme related to lactoylglutathione lyase